LQTFVVGCASARQALCSRFSPATW